MKPHAHLHQLLKIKQGLKEGYCLAFKATEGFTSVEAEKAKYLCKEHELGLPLICDKILSFLHKHHLFDAGLLQRWVEQRALRLERQERSFFHRLVSLFGRGKQVNESAAELRILAKAIEAQRQGVNPHVVTQFLHLPKKLETADEQEREKLFQFIERHHRTYLKELLDLCDILDKSSQPPIRSFAARLHTLLEFREKELLDILFEGNVIEVHDLLTE